MKNRQKDKYALFSDKLDLMASIPVEKTILLQEDRPGVDMKIKDIQISGDTEGRLLKGFIEQEAAEFFLEKSVSLNSLALLLGSNPRYVSYIIHKYRGKDFYAYIQMKRVEYIVVILQKDCALLDYKLAHLADMSGFSNPSKFSIAFKSEMGIPPSAFVHLLKNDQSSRGC
ncbi:AraC family transcriptional regulator [Sphingobacterium sp. KU25419]|nr:AraC family transcriptional regulator [Sphingobacterium sp. KU25419]